MARKRSYSSSSSSDSSSSSSDSSSSSSSSSSPTPVAKKSKVPLTETPPTEKGAWNSDNEFVMQLEKDKKEVAKIKVKNFNGQVYVDIRKYYDEGTKPTTKGISLKPEIFEKMINYKDLVSEAIELVEKKRDSLSPRYEQVASIIRDDKKVSVSIELDRGHMMKVYKFKQMLLVDVRNFYNGGPTKKGISIQPDIFEKISHWGEWKQAADKLK